MIIDLNEINGIEEFKVLLSKSSPILTDIFMIKKISGSLEYGDYTFYIEAPTNNDFYFYLDSSLSDIEQIFEFLESIANIKNEIGMVISSDGPEVTLYAKPIDEYKIRLFMVDTCEAYDKFVKDIIKTYSYSEAKILCDIVIDKRILIKQFFEKLEVLFEDYETIDVAPYGNSLDNIGKWLTKIKMGCVF